ncbi:hypothetical protein HNP38_003185 [Chryseobacterium defluvii]|uniref:Resolvase HTH domain-containing protein n=1 Tax=Chryseobacterium defluvii TaxID=160396 RepID=A0A840KE90_9FLAO|nr:helix-turn-helix domain-containing protein [Chryseobacterium defluvii]MBB4807869.1 hypothetical protein [Chryseobacterium defluvii]
MQFKNIHIGSIIKQRVTEYEIGMSRICNFLKCKEEDVKIMYHTESLDSALLLRWSKLLGYDFFRVYSQHLILYSPQVNIKSTDASQNHQIHIPQFRKNIYTKELIDFILELLENGEKTKQEIIDEYKIPKTTLYKWASKYKK